MTAARPTPDRHTPYKLRLKRSRRWKAGLGVVVLAVAVGVTHTLEHLRVFTVYKPGFDDLLLGWPMAGVLALIGLMIMGSS